MIVIESGNGSHFTGSFSRPPEMLFPVTGFPVMRPAERLLAGRRSSCLFVARGCPTRKRSSVAGEDLPSDRNGRERGNAILILTVGAERVLPESVANMPLLFPFAKKGKKFDMKLENSDFRRGVYLLYTDSGDLVHRYILLRYSKYDYG